jgi:hypothetical protein
MKLVARLKSLSLVVVAVLFMMGTFVSACGSKTTEQTEQTEDAAEHPEGGEHPSDSSEHPSDDSEHPGGEHPADSTAND